MKKILTGYLCIFTLGVASWPLPASATGGENPGPACDEITSAHLCSGYAVPEILVTAPRPFWSYGHYWHSILDRLSDQQLRDFTDATRDEILSQLPADYNITTAHVSSRQGTAEHILESRERLAQISTWYEEYGPTCQELSAYASLMGAVVVVGSTVPHLASFPGVVIGFSLMYSGFYSTHYICD